MPLMVRPGITGKHTISVSGLEDFDFVKLEDKKLLLLVNLKANPLYEFEAEPENAPDRFILHFSEHIDLPANQPPVVFVDNGFIIIKNRANLSGKVTVINAMGQLIYTSELQSGTSTLRLDLPSGIYIANISTSFQSFSNKIFY